MAVTLGWIYLLEAHANLVTLVLDIPRRNSVKGWRSHVKLDIPRRSSLKGWQDHIWVGLVTLVLDIPRVCIEGLHIVYGSHVRLGYVS